MEATKLRIYPFAVLHKQWTLVVGYWCSPNGNNSFMQPVTAAPADAMFHITINCIMYEINSVVNAAAIQSTYLLLRAHAHFMHIGVRVHMLYAISISIIV